MPFKTENAEAAGAALGAACRSQLRGRDTEFNKPRIVVAQRATMPRFAIVSAGLVLEFCADRSAAGAAIALAKARAA